MRCLKNGMHALAVAAGPTHVASLQGTRLLRRTENGFQEQQIDLKRLLRGKGHDVSLRNDDVLFVPSSAIKESLNPLPACEGARQPHASPRCVQSLCAIPRWVSMSTFFKYPFSFAD